MQKLYLILLCLLFLPACQEAQGWMNPVMIGGGVIASGGGECSTSNDVQLNHANCVFSDGTLWTISKTNWMGEKITFSVATDITEVSVYVKDLNTENYFSLIIYADNGSGLPNTAVSYGGQQDKTAAEIGSSLELITFTYPSPVELASGTYHFMVKGTGAGTPGYQINYKNATSCVAFITYTENGGSSFTASDPNDLGMGIYGCQ